MPILQVRVYMAIAAIAAFVIGVGFGHYAW
jgi:hypothetical protein